MKNTHEINILRPHSCHVEHFFFIFLSFFHSLCFISLDPYVVYILYLQWQHSVCVTTTTTARRRRRQWWLRIQLSTQKRYIMIFVKWFIQNIHHFQAVYIWLCCAPKHFSRWAFKQCGVSLLYSRIGYLSFFLSLSLSVYLFTFWATSWWADSSFIYLHIVHWHSRHLRFHFIGLVEFIKMNWIKYNNIFVPWLTDFKMYVSHIIWNMRLVFSYSFIDCLLFSFNVFYWKSSCSIILLHSKYL